MRITGSRLMQLGMSSTASAQEELATKAEQVTSGRRVATPSDDPVAWAAAQRATVKQILARGTSAAIDTAREALLDTDTALAAIGDAVSEARSLAIQGANASYDANSRRVIGLHVRALFQTALGAANQQSPSGEYLLAGANSLTAPFAANGAYQGDATSRSLAGGNLASIDGARLTAADGVDVLPLLDRLATALDTNDTTTLASVIDQLDDAVQQVARARSRGGAASTVLDSAADATAQLDDKLSREIANRVEIDPIAAAADLARASQALEASRLVSSHLASLLDPRMMGL